ncbi:MAG: hypothetical protein ACFKPT_00370 [Gloeotrichia echinulata GP01]
MDLEVIATTQKGKSAIEQLANLQPDIVLMLRLKTYAVLGAMGYLLTDVSVEELRETIRFACQGYSQLEPRLLGQTILQAPISTSASSKSADRGSAVKIPAEGKKINLSVNRSQFKLFGNLIPHPSMQKEISSLSNQPSANQISWYQLLILLIIAVGCTTGIYLMREVLRKPLPSLNYIQQESTLLGTEFNGKVKPGKILKIADADLEVSLTQSQADKLPLPQRQDSVERTKAIYEISQSRVDRFTELYQQGAIAKDQLEQAEADLKVAKADYRVAQTAAATAINLELAKKQKFQLQRQVSLEQQQWKRQELEQQLHNFRLEYQQATERLNLIRQQSTQLFQRKMPSVNTIIKATSPGVVVQL